MSDNLELKLKEKQNELDNLLDLIEESKSLRELRKDIEYMKRRGWFK